MAKTLSNTYAKALSEFNHVFKPKVSYAKLIREEFNEWFTEMEEGTPEKELKELCDLLYVVYGFADVKGKGWNIERNQEEINKMKASFDEIVKKYPSIKMGVVSISTAYLHFIVDTSEYMWLYRLAQSIYVYADLKGWPLHEAFKRVHASNMSKLENGKVVYREDGKVLKGKNYKPANLSDLIAPKQAKKKKVASK